MRYRQLLMGMWWLCGQALFAQQTGFETEIPVTFRADGKGKLSLSASYYKEGKQSLVWNFRPGSALQVDLEQPLTLGKELTEEGGITLWIYNETPQTDSVRFEFLTPERRVAYRFGFRLAAAGWRACWINFAHMQREAVANQIGSYSLIAPQRKGRIFLDRLTFPVRKINDRTTPDQQLPANNSLANRDLWHWCRVWQWEQYVYDLPLADALTPAEAGELHEVTQRLTQWIETSQPTQKAIDQAHAVFRKAAIRPSGSGFTGAPLVAPDELNRRQGELTWKDLETMLAGFAYEAYYHRSETAKARYFQVWDYAIDQGFAYGSGMGTNHHYGYQVRNIYTTAWLMRDAIRQSSAHRRILSALTFWAALQETRCPCSPHRDELLDSWHTLLTPKLIAALMQPSDTERARALQGLSRWVSTSLHHTPGTIGGIKVDGTAFHHGGCYPAYTSGALAAVARFAYLTAHTRYAVSVPARRVLREGLLAMRNYSHLHEWGIGLGGRHPYGGRMNAEDVAAFALLALAGDLEEKGAAFDRSLAADYLRLCPKPTPEAAYFRAQGVCPAPAPEGFWVYNYAAAGIFRRPTWMVTLKGYNTDVWGAEIYRNDNRYGRYQSYGSVQIMGEASRAASGYEEDGWDWNRLPGTTTIHLPFEQLDSPLPGTTMAHSRENFAGASALQGRNGVFGIKLMERDYPRFTPDFVARKSVFCFDNRLICLGTGIRNSQAQAPTETTLFQSRYRLGQALYVQGTPVHRLGFTQTLTASEGQPVYVRDGYRNHYLVKKGTVKVQLARQTSRHDKTRAQTQGDFASAWIDHGTAPCGEGYEYLVLIQPTDTLLTPDAYPTDSYEVRQCTDQAHIVYDRPTGITAYVVFDAIDLATDSLFRRLPAETLVMRQACAEGLRLSVCDPNLNLAEKTYTTPQPSRPLYKQLWLKGAWQLQVPHPQVEVTLVGGDTRLTVRCLHGQPVETILVARPSANP